MRRQLDLLLCAVQFLTRLPVPVSPRFDPDWTTRSARYFPLVGQFVGALSGGVLLLADGLWSGWLPALLAVLAGVLITGAFHEDGLADTADGLGGGATRERRLEIMKDSRIGTYGALALGFCLALKVAALSQTPFVVAAAGLVAAHGGGRAAAVVVMRLLPHVSDPRSAKYRPAPDGVRTWEAALALLIAAWPLVLLPPGAWGIGLAAAIALALALALASRRLVGGYTGDVLGAVEQLFELGFVLGIAAAAR